MGLSRAGYEVVGYDIEPQPNYPFEFHQADALTVDLSGFDAVWASPPCQYYTIMRNLPWLKDNEYWDSIPPTREYLEQSGLPFVIENVMGAVWSRALEGGWLCGGMFGLPFYRHRAFETNWFWLAPGHPKHKAVILAGGMIAGRARQVTYTRPDGSRSSLAQSTGGHRSKAESTATAIGMGIDWMTRQELSQAVPPAYAEYIGRQLLDQ